MRDGRLEASLGSESRVTMNGIIIPNDLCKPMNVLHSDSPPLRQLDHHLIIYQIKQQTKYTLSRLFELKNCCGQIEQNDRQVSSRCFTIQKDISANSKEFSSHCVPAHPLCLLTANNSRLPTSSKCPQVIAIPQAQQLYNILTNKPMIVSPQKSTAMHSPKYSLLDIDVNEITKNIFLGDQKCAKNYQFLKQLGIQHIIVTGEELNVHFPDSFNYLHVRVKDSPKEDISLHFEGVCQFIEAALKKKESILVHCAFGVSRSATVVIAFLMRKLKISYLQAFIFVRRKRPIIKPNYGFEEQLKKWGSSPPASQK